MKKSKNEKGSKTKSTQKRSTLNLVKDMRYGRTLSIDFFRNNGWLLIIFVVAIIALMGLRYKTKTRMEEIKRLTQQLQMAESSKLQEKSAYMSLIREAEMKKLVEEKGLGLQFQENPPYELILSDN